MMNAVVAAALETLKSTDGKGHLGGFRAYVAKHGQAPGRHVLGATDRRRDAACALMGISKAEYNARAEAFVAKLLAKHPDLAARDFALSLAYSFCSHAALAQAVAALPKAEPAAVVTTSVTAATAPEPRAVPKAARAAAPRAPRKAPAARPAVDPRAARRAELLRDVERVRGQVESALFRATYHPDAYAPDAWVANAEGGIDG